MLAARLHSFDVDSIVRQVLKTCFDLCKKGRDNASTICVGTDIAAGLIAVVLIRCYCKARAAKLLKENHCQLTRSRLKKCVSQILTEEKEKKEAEIEAKKQK